MNRLITSVFAIGIALLLGPPAFCADLVGNVIDLQGRAVPGVEVVVQDTAGNIFGRATTDAAGHYEIAGLSPSTYDYTLNPLATGFKGGNAVSYLDRDGLTVNWKVSPVGDAVALASPGSKAVIAGDPFGLSMPEFISVLVLGTTVAAGGAVGGYGGAGGFSSSSSSPPAPPSSSSQ